MSPKTTPSAAKLKPAAPIAEAGLRFSAEILITRISMDHSIQPRDRAAEQRDGLHCPMPPVLPTERIAHLGTVDCCIHPPGRNEMIAITPPKIFSKEVAQKQATPFPRQDLLTARNRFRPNFRGWRLDEFSIFANPLHPGAPLTPP